MKRNTIIITVLAVAAIILIIVAAIGKTKDTSSESIKIGAVLSFTGAASADGEALKQGIELARQDLAKQGVQVEVIYQDDKTEPKDGVAVVNFMKAQQVDAIIGPTWSFVGDAVLPILDQTGTVAIMPITTTEVVQGTSPYLFHGSIKNALMEETFVKFLKEHNHKKVAFIGNDDAWTNSIQAPLEKAVAAADGSLVVTERLPFGTEAASMPSIVTKIKQAQPDVIIFSIFDDQGISALVKKSREQGMVIPIVSSDSSLRRVISSGLLEGMSRANLYDIAPKTDGAFAQKYREAYTSEPLTYSDRGYDALMILVEAIQNKGDMALADYLHQKTDYKGYATTYDFDEKGDIEGGEWVLSPIQ